MEQESRTSSQLLREARRSASLSQTELAQRAGVAQSVVSAYESGRREPALSTLVRLIHATGNSLSLTIERMPGSRPGLPDTLVGRRLRQRRSAVLAVAGRHGVKEIKVFGSVARGEDRPDSDIDLVAALPATMGLIELGTLERELTAVLGQTVDLVPADGIRPAVRVEIENEAISL